MAISEPDKVGLVTAVSAFVPSVALEPSAIVIAGLPVTDTGVLPVPVPCNCDSTPLSKAISEADRVGSFIAESDLEPCVTLEPSAIDTGRILLIK